jgi:hypothetical protein
MNEGVKILLERMKTNPEEFINGTKWAGLIHGYKQYLNKEDSQELDDAYNALMQQHFTERVMKELLSPEEDDSLGKWFTKQPIGTPLGGATRVGSSVGNVNAVHNNGLTLTAGAGTGYSWANTSTTTAQLQQAQAAQNTLLHELLHHKALAAQNLSTTPVEVNKKPVVKKHKTLFGKLFNYT